MPTRTTSFYVTDSARPRRLIEVSTAGHVVDTLSAPHSQINATPGQLNGVSHVQSVVFGTALMAFVHEDGSVRVAPRTGPVVVAHNPQGVNRIVFGARRWGPDQAPSPRRPAFSLASYSTLS